MAHNIYIDSSGNAAIASFRESPWHKLGTVFEKEVDGKELLDLAHLNWKVIEAPIFAQLPDGRSISDSNHKAVIREDSGEIFGIVGQHYEVFQNDEIMDVFEQIRLKQTSINFNYEVAGAINAKNSMRVWILARVKDLDYNVKNDEIRQYLLITSTHDGTGALSIFPTAIRVVCQNTMNLAFSAHRRYRRNEKKGIHYSIKHTKNMRVMVAQAVEAINQTIELNRFNREIHQKLAEVPATGDMKREFFEFIVDYGKDEAKKLEKTKQAETIRENKLATLDRVLKSATNQTDAARGTAWGLLQAGIEYVDYYARTRVVDENADEYSQRFDSANFGNGFNLKNEMQHKIAELAGVN